MQAKLPSVILSPALPKISFLVNQKITFPNLRVIDNEGKNLGVLTKEEAFRITQEKQLDIVVVNEETDPPVAKIVEWGKFLYDYKQKLKKTAKSGHTSEQKELRLTPAMGKKDLNDRIERAKEFLGNKDKVKFTVVFKGREMRHPEVGQGKLKETYEALQKICEIEKEPYWEGRRLMFVVKPK